MRLSLFGYEPRTSEENSINQWFLILQTSVDGRNPAPPSMVESPYILAPDFANIHSMAVNGSSSSLGYAAQVVLERYSDNHCWYADGSKPIIIIWGFPERVPPDHPFQWDFPWTKPTSYNLSGVPPFIENPPDLEEFTSINPSPLGFPARMRPRRHLRLERTDASAKSQPAFPPEELENSPAEGIRMSASLQMVSHSLNSLDNYFVNGWKW